VSRTASTAAAEPGAQALPSADAALEAWETRLSGTTRPTGGLAMRLESESGATGVLNVRMRGDHVLAILGSADPALIKSLERDLPGLRQSLRERGVDAHVALSSPAGAGETHDRESNGDPSPRSTPSARRGDANPRRTGSARREVHSMITPANQPGLFTRPARPRATTRRSDATTS